jgi:hypothetical protein
VTEEDLKAVLAKYQQKCFELFNSNIVLETQVERLTAEIEKLKKVKRGARAEEDFS